MNVNVSSFTGGLPGRICIARMMPRGIDIPHLRFLAPNRELLWAYKHGEIDWEEYTATYWNETARYMSMENNGLVTMTRGDIYWTLLTVELAESSVDSTLRGLAVGNLKALTLDAVRNLGDTSQRAICRCSAHPALRSRLRRCISSRRVERRGQRRPGTPAPGCLAKTSM